jgi:hypothetical protein
MAGPGMAGPGTKRGNGRHAWLGTIQGVDRQGAEKAWVERPLVRFAVDLPAVNSKLLVPAKDQTLSNR